MRQKRFFIWLTVLVAANLLGTGCSFRQMGYDNAAWLAQYRAGSLFDLNPEQEAALKPKAVAYVDWLKIHKRPELIHLLADVKQAALAGVTMQDIQNFHGRYVKIRESVLKSLIPIAQDLLPTLTNAQWDHLERKLKERWEDRKARAEALDFKTYEKLEQKRLEERLEFFDEMFGGLTASQKSLFLLMSRQDQPKAEELYQSGMAAIEKFVATLRVMKDPVQIGQLLVQWIEDPELFYGEKANRLREEVRHLGWQTYLILQKTQSLEQQRAFQSYVEDWINFLETQESSGNSG